MPAPMSVASGRLRASGVIVDLGTVTTPDTIELRGLRNQTVTGRITLTGTGSHLPARQRRTRSALRLVDCENLTVEVEVIGPHKGAGVYDNAYVESLEAQHAFELQGCRNVRLLRCNASFVYGDFVYLNRCERIRVREFDFHHNGRQGFGIVAAKDVLIWAGKVGHVRRSVFDFEPHFDDSVVQDVKVTWVEVGPHRLNLISAAGRGDVSNVTFDVISGTDDPFQSVISSHPQAPRRRGWTLRNMTTNAGYGSTTGRCIEFDRVDGVTVENVTQPLQRNRGMALVKTIDCTKVALSGNTHPGGVELHQQ